ncbi:unnamed protein product [Echinostoma caproni]|uniref:TIP41-like protein n=1 Tax=Echinostoma caproni TaxID=27848 RepID=A0A183AVE5_9TREM|nr:unnamed protein product [Echinostoma caproni]
MLKPYINIVFSAVCTMLRCSEIVLDINRAVLQYGLFFSDISVVNSSARASTHHFCNEADPSVWNGVPSCPLTKDRFLSQFSSSSSSGSWDILLDSDGLDMALLQRRDPILFYADTTLYEDELGDNGISMLNVKFRAMHSGFFLLQRFFLRVDGGLVRCFDTRLQWRTEDKMGRQIHFSEEIREQIDCGW